MLTSFSFAQDATSTDNVSNDAQASDVKNEDANEAPQSAGKIKDLQFEGLTRTSEKWLMSMFGGFIGCPLQYFNPAQLEGGLKAIDVFREIKIDLIKENEDDENSDVVVKVTVKEKWSLFGAIFGWGDDAGFVGSFAFVDMNAFGRKNMFMAMGNFGADIQEGNFMYMKPPMSQKKPGLIVNANVSNNTPYYSTFDDDKIAKKEMLKTGCSISIMGFCPAFMYTAGLGYSYMGWFHDNIKNLHVNTLSLTLSKGYDKSNDWFPLPRNVAVSGKFDLDWARYAKPMGEITFNGTVALPIKNYPRMLFKLSAFGGFTFARPITMQFNRDTVKSFIALNSWATDMIGSGRFSWETGLVKAKFMTMSIFASYEVVVGRDLQIDTESDDHLDVKGSNEAVWAMGPGAGVKIYFHEIPIPAMILGAFYNINLNKWQFGFSIGF